VTDSLTYSLDEAANRIGGRCTARWLADKIRDRQIPAVRISRELRMTDANIAEALTLLAVESSDGLTSRSRKRLGRRAS
jgi:hypothetical protein